MTVEKLKELYYELKEELKGKYEERLVKLEHLINGVDGNDGGMRKALKDLIHEVKKIPDQIMIQFKEHMENYLEVKIKEEIKLSKKEDKDTGQWIIKIAQFALYAILAMVTIYFVITTGKAP